ncbi:MAG: adenylosuccinate synthase [Gammaproteobacteria bacterium]|nr:adenylosuccinate synthase [Gammaproteobacteria bacterium]
MTDFRDQTAARGIVLIGAQWGDEGKGKVVDLLAGRCDAVVRFQGGHNAGHTVIHDGETMVLHLLPSGILNPGVECLIGNGVALYLPQFFKELESIRRRGVDPAGRLFVSPDCPLILPSHMALDQARERHAGRGRIGTTGRGIGPAYEDKAARRAVRAGELFAPRAFRRRLAAALDLHNFMLEKYYGAEPVNSERVADEWLAMADELHPLVADVAARLETLDTEGRAVLFEGAQGVMLDIDHGTYPYVTSSSTVAAGALAGSGAHLAQLREVVGVVKAYTTRVGEGPFPTELQDEVGRRLAREGAEWGATTGRARRCGWFDAVAVRGAALRGSIGSLCITKLDVLDGVDPLRICTGYQVDGGITDARPALMNRYAECVPCYEQMDGWGGSTRGVTRWEDLPQRARAYIERLEALVGLEACIVSTGPAREETIIRRHPFDS